LINSRIGPLSYAAPCNGSAHPEVQNSYDTVNGVKLKRSHDLLFDGDTFENFSRCTSSDHTECLQVEPADNVTIRNSVFRRCDTIVINFANDFAGDSKSAAGYGAPNNILIENNFLDEAMDNSGGPTYYSLNMRECTNCTIRYNSWLQEPRQPTGEISRNNRYVGNLGPMSQGNCYSNGVSYAYNVWKGAKCGRTDRRVRDLGFLRSTPGRFNLHLRRNSPRSTTAANRVPSARHRRPAEAARLESRRRSRRAALRLGGLRELDAEQALDLDRGPLAGRTVPELRSASDARPAQQAGDLREPARIEAQDHIRAVGDRHRPLGVVA
jgi:hypothetical protein